MQQVLGLQRTGVLQRSTIILNVVTPRQVVRGRFLSSHRCHAAANDDAGVTPSESEEGASQQLTPEDIQLAVEFYLKEKKNKSVVEEDTGGQAVPEDSQKEPQPEVTSLVEVEDTSSALVETPSPSSPDAANDDSTAAAPPNGTSHHQQQEQQKKDTTTLLRLQEELLGMVASLDRGLIATKDDVIRVDNLVRQLEYEGGQVILSEDLFGQLGGRWRLVYSSGFAGGNLGGARPGPQAGLIPLKVGQVYQDIFLAARRLDNVVSLAAKFSLASLSGSGAEPPTVTARLEHSFDILGANTVRITYDKTVVKGSGGLGGWLNGLPEVATPMLPEPLRSMFADARSATFEVVYLDERMRITRGDRGELRVFFKEI